MSNSTGVLPSICILCNKAQNKTKSVLNYCQAVVICEYDAPASNVKAAAETLNETTMLTKIGSIGFPFNIN